MRKSEINTSGINAGQFFDDAHFLKESVTRKSSDNFDAICRHTSCRPPLSFFTQYQHLRSHDLSTGPTHRAVSPSRVSPLAVASRAGDRRKGSPGSGATSAGLVPGQPLFYPAGLRGFIASWRECSQFVLSYP